MRIFISKIFKISVILLIALFFSGCNTIGKKRHKNNIATTQLQVNKEQNSFATPQQSSNSSSSNGANNSDNSINNSDIDPYESFNRKVYYFNHGIDRLIFRPVAIVYDKILPWPVQKGINNFFFNFREVTNIANDLLQLNIVWAASDTWRLMINSTVGLLGLVDVATYMGLTKHEQDLGITFAKWGAKNTPYFVLPILGPSTIRDAIALPLNYTYLALWTHIDDRNLRYAFIGTYFIDRRASILPGDKFIDQAFDPYIAVRSAYLQRRAYLIKKSLRTHHGNNFVEEKEYGNQNINSEAAHTNQNNKKVFE